MHVYSSAPLWLWLLFGVFVFTLLALDLGVFHRRDKTVTTRSALCWTAIWIALALLFNLYLYWQFGSEPALEYLAGYLMEKALSVDNLFVFLLLFRYFAVPAPLQHRVLFWGILAAIVFRGLFILAGSILIQSFAWMLYLFGVFLVLTGGKLVFSKSEVIHPEKNWVLKILRKFIPVLRRYKGNHFLLKRKGKYYATPLLLVLLTLEATDVIFALDSIPAIFGITQDPFIIFSSNIFAILGLRSLYFALSGMMNKFRYLKYGLGAILVFVGLKMLVHEKIDIPISVSLATLAVLLGTSVLASLLRPSSTALPVTLDKNR